METTLAIIKPDAFGRNLAGPILAILEQDGFRLRAARVTRLSTVQAQEFYAVHRGQPFYDALVRFMTSGPIMPVVLERDGAIARLRSVIGATDPAEADEGTIRARYAESKERNAIHASDAPDTAAREIRFFFPDAELLQTGSAR